MTELFLIVVKAMANELAKCDGPEAVRGMCDTIVAAGHEMEAAEDRHQAAIVAADKAEKDAEQKRLGELSEAVKRRKYVVTEAGHIIKIENVWANHTMDVIFTASNTQKDVNIDFVSDMRDATIADAEASFAKNGGDVSEIATCEISVFNKASAAAKVWRELKADADAKIR